jgi:hypothetical protein
MRIVNCESPLSQQLSLPLLVLVGIHFVVLDDLVNFFIFGKFFGARFEKALCSICPNLFKFVCTSR